jgi:ABC-type Fe3+ transport system substrate-binding protein
MVARGLGDALEESFLENVGPMLPLNVLLVARDITPSEFYRAAQLDGALSTRDAVEARSLVDSPTGQGMHLLGLMPCPLRQPLTQAFEAFLATNPPREPLKWCLEGNANQQLSFYGFVPHFERLDDLPDVMISPGVNSFFGSAFRKRFLDHDCFADISDDDTWADPAYQHLRDPLRHFTVLCWNVLVMVIDHTHFSGSTLPRRWADLLGPEYRNTVAIRGQKDFFCETVLLNVYQQFGMEGVEQLAESVAYAMHPAEMVKWAGVGRRGKPAVLVMPYFFAKLIQRKDRVTIVWPEDGAIASPVSMLIKRRPSDDLANIGRFFAGSDVAKICARAMFPSHHPAARAHLPQHAPLRWLGWEFIRNEDVDDCQKRILDRFLPVYRRSTPVAGGGLL